jgi:hypothetical protein
MVIRVLTIQFQLDGQESKSQEESLSDQILVLMMRLYLRKRIHSLDSNLNMFQKSHLFTVINHYIIQYQEVGAENKFQVENSRDQILVSMMKLSLSRKNLMFKAFNN